MLMIIVTLLSALAIAGVAAYFSIVGLAALFAAAFWPVVVMASSLELGKLIATSWVYQTWDYSPARIRYPLITMILAVMLITSMGIFGFLSKGHLDVQGPIELQKIELQFSQEDVILIRERIEALDDETSSYRSEIKVLDSLIASYPENYASRKIAERAKQQPERTRISAGIEENRRAKRKELDLLRQQTKIASETQSTLTEQEGDLGPIKYVAEALGINPDEGVRFVILIIIFAFDPLAVLLVLAANISITHKYGRSSGGVSGLLEAVNQSPDMEPEEIVYPEIYHSEVDLSAEEEPPAEGVGPEIDSSAIAYLKAMKNTKLRSDREPGIPKKASDLLSDANPVPRDINEKVK